MRVERGGWLYPLAGPLSVTSPITMCCASLVCLRRPAKKRTRLDDNIVVAAYGASLRQTPCSPCVAVPHTRSSPPLSFPVHDAAVLALGLLASNRFFRAARTSRASRRTPAPQAHSKDGEPTRQMRPQRWLETARRGAGMAKTKTHTPGSLWSLYPPRGVQGWRACPNAQPGCSTRGAPSAAARQLHLLLTDSELALPFDDGVCITPSKA